MIQYYAQRTAIRYIIYHANDDLGSADGQCRPVTIEMIAQHPKTARVVSEGYSELSSHVPSGVDWTWVSNTPPRQ